MKQNRRIPKNIMLDALREKKRDDVSHLPDRGPCDVRRERLIELPVKRVKEDIYMIEGAGKMTRNQVYEWICQRTSAGESLVDICSASGSPSIRTVYAWMRHFPEFRKQFEDCKKIRGMVVAERVIHEADAATPNTANAQKVKIDALKWMASKLDPATFADRNIQEVKHDLSALSDDELHRQLKAAIVANKDLLKDLSHDDLKELAPIIDVEPE